MSKLESLLTEQRNPASESIDALSTQDVLRVINAEDRKVADAVGAAIPAVSRAVDGIVQRLEKGGKLFYIGAGTSGRLGVLDASECPPTFSVPYDMVQGIIAGGEAALSRATEASEDDPGSGEKDVRARGLTAADSLVGIAASGRTPYVLGAIRYARQIGALTVGIACTSDSELSREAEVAIELLTGPEVVTGSTRMKAGTATKLTLNMITTAAMIKLGYVYGNLMVNVQPRNEKLRDRARRIIQHAAGADEAAAASLLEQTGDVRAAILMFRRGVSAEKARQMLQKAGGSLRKALE